MTDRDANTNGFSRREFLIRMAQTCTLILLGSCSPSLKPAATSAPELTLTPDPTTPPSPTPSPTFTSITATPAADDLDVKIGQLVLVGFRGLAVMSDSPIVQDIIQRHIGGVVLFDYDVPSSSPVRNIQSPQQLKALTASLQKFTAQQGAHTPLFIATDQEGGQVNRLKPEFGFPPSVSEQYLGTLNDPATTRRYAETTAQTLSQMGLNLNLAPVVDLNTNPTNPIIGQLERSFSADPTIVTNNSLEVIKAHSESGVLTTLKHFPGHGSSTADSHLGFVDVTNTWSQVELEPYRRIIAAGMCDAVMTAHIFNAHLDPDLPATLSQRIITGILREQLHYDGVVMSDDMQMKAISDYYGFDNAIQLAINAGVDIITIANTVVYDDQAATKTVAAIKRAVQDGKISRDRIEQSYQRIMKLKARVK